MVERRGGLMARKTSFYYAFLVLPAAQRRAIIAVWDFCRAVDDAVDEPAPGEAAAPESHAMDARRAEVGFWREELARCYGPSDPQTPQGRALKPFITEFDLPRQAFEDVIDGVAMDIDTTRYATFADLLTYCHRVASAVGLICIRIFGCTGATAREYALNLGVALQLTNIIRDVPDDLSRGRVYLPLEDLDATGCRIEDLAAGAVSAPVRRLLEFQCRRAREYYQKALQLRPAEDRRRLVAAEIMRAVYFETLQRIERRGYDVFSSRTRVPRPVQAAIALRQWLVPA
jgi:phytoene synthase